jgi:hypothetical protein
MIQAGVVAAVVLSVTVGCAAKTSNKPANATPATATTATTAPATTVTPTTVPPTTPAPTAPPTTKPSLTLSQENVVEAAQQYLSEGMGFSQAALIKQLSSQYGNGYSVADATVAVNSLNVDWNAQAVLSAKNYLKTEPFSCTALVNQLSSAYGAQFTLAQAQYGAKAAGIC